MIPTDVHDALNRLEIQVPDDVMAQLAEYLAFLLETNKTMNLTAIRDEAVAWHRMIVDSLTILPGLIELEAGATVLDIGTGGGLPGIPIAIARPDLKVSLLESVGKKCKFLNEVKDKLDLENLAVLNGRAENFGKEADHREKYDLVVSRALGPMNVILEFMLPFAKVEGGIIAMKGPKAIEELNESGDALQLLGAGDLEIFEAYPESFENDLVFVTIAKEHPTPPEYPREPGTPKRSPL